MAFIKCSSQKRFTSAGDTTSLSADYFRIQTEGGQWLWVFRELETGRWFVQGGW